MTSKLRPSGYHSTESPTAHTNSNSNSYNSDNNSGRNNQIRLQSALRLPSKYSSVYIARMNNGDARNSCINTNTHITNTRNISVGDKRGNISWNLSFQWARSFEQNTSVEHETSDFFDVTELDAGYDQEERELEEQRWEDLDSVLDYEGIIECYRNSAEGAKLCNLMRNLGDLDLEDDEDEIDDHCGDSDEFDPELIDFPQTMLFEEKKLLPMRGLRKVDSSKELLLKNKVKRRRSSIAKEEAYQEYVDEERKEDTMGENNRQQGIQDVNDSRRRIETQVEEKEETRENNTLADDQDEDGSLTDLLAAMLEIADPKIDSKRGLSENIKHEHDRTAMLQSADAEFNCKRRSSENILHGEEARRRQRPRSREARINKTRAYYESLKRASEQDEFGGFGKGLNKSNRAKRELGVSNEVFSSKISSILYDYDR